MITHEQRTKDEFQRGYFIGKVDISMKRNMPYDELLEKSRAFQDGYAKALDDYSRVAQR